MVKQSDDYFSATATAASIATDLDVPPGSVKAAIDLLLDGNTLPFIARYRKEATGSLDENALRVIEDGLHAAQELSARKVTILKELARQGNEDEAFRERIIECDDRKLLEELYFPFRPTRRTRATVARERGLMPLAELLLSQEPPTASRKNILTPFVNEKIGVPDTDAALLGACDIVAEVWAADPAARELALVQLRQGHLVSKVKRGKRDDSSRFAEWFDRREPVKRVPSHRFLAMQRGENEGVLRLSIAVDDDFMGRRLRSHFLTNPKAAFAAELRTCVEDCWQRLLQPAAESAVMSDLKQAADAEAVSVFAKNLRDLLLAPPAGADVTIGIDPGFRTGCKVAIVDGTGRFLNSRTIYPTPPKNDVDGASSVLAGLIKQHDVKLIAIGNGTASRETDKFVSEVITREGFEVTKAIVSESGASIYSASELAAAEYPELDLTVRGAISIAHRLQDPLAELVKLDPRSIGVGQYQYDVDQKLLHRALEREVLSCVNSVGVELNQASASLLSYVSGIGPALAKKIVDFRDSNGPFRSRDALLRIPRFGAKAFQQSAGFLRISDSENPLDRTSVHPESYRVVERMAATLDVPANELVGRPSLATKLNVVDFVDHRVGTSTVSDIIAELARPGRDPRREFKTARFREGVDDVKDLKPGMVLEGTISNVTNFGAFVDIGVHQDGLVHISQLADRFVSDPNDVVATGQIVRVTVLEVDVDRNRISLSLRKPGGSGA